MLSNLIHPTPKLENMQLLTSILIRIKIYNRNCITGRCNKNFAKFHPIPLNDMEEYVVTKIRDGSPLVLLFRNDKVHVLLCETPKIDSDQNLK